MPPRRPLPDPRGGGENTLAFLTATLRTARQATSQTQADRTVPIEHEHPFDPAALGLKEIGNLASWTVSSCKPGCGVEALRDEDTGLFWQCAPFPFYSAYHSNGTTKQC